MRLARLAATTALVSSLVWGAACAAEDFAVAIAPQGLSDALAELAEQTGVQLLFVSSDVAGLRANGLSGTYEIDSALKRLLEGTGLEFHAVGRGTYAVRRPAARQEGAREDASVTLAQLEGEGAPADQGGRGGAPGAGGPVDEIVVTARKRAERLQDVPIAVTAFSSDRLADRGIDDFKELFQLVPDAMTADLGASFSNEIIIRGQGAGRNVNSETATGIYRNGIFVAGGNIGGRNFNTMDLFDVARVEVLRGPQGALYGRNAVGGAVNVVTRRPVSELGAEGTASYGEADRYEAAGVVNVPLSDELAVRAGLKYIDQRDGFFTDRLTGEVKDEESFLGGRVGLRWAPDGDFSAVLTLEYFSEDGPSFGVGTYNPLLATDPYSQSAFNFPTVFKRGEFTGQLELEYDMGFARLTAVSVYKTRDAETSDDVDAFTNTLSPNMLTRISDDEFRRVGGEVRLASSGAGPWRWLAGVEYASVTDEFLVNSNNSRLSNSDSEDWTAAAFGSLGLDLTERLNVTGELRYSYDDKEVELTSRLALASPTRVQSFSKSFDNLAPKATLAYRVSDDLNTYASIGTGYRAGGFNPEPDNAAVERFAIPYDEETSVSYEVGAKAKLFDRLALNLAVFYSTTSDLQLLLQFVPVGGGAPLNAVTNGGDSVQYGAELEGGARFDIEATGGQLAVDFGGSWMTSEIDSALPGVDGTAIPYVRDWSANFGATYRQPLLNSGLGLVLGYGYRGGFGGWQDETSGRDLDDIELHDVRAGLEAAHWSLIGSVDNLLDTFYVPQRTNATAVRASRPQTWKITLSAKF
ncbi:MAG: TonB-dependent receptor [Alphaproteobacteria bacterium]|nr:TonB-dependent receptor [Alphaproteobacteria bacterium]